METVERTKSQILIVDHNLLLLEGICSLIGLEPDLELAGAAKSASQAVQMFRERRPEVVLMDLDLPEAAGIRSIREICELDPTVCVLGLFTHPWDECSALALRAGARSCITKDRLNRDLVALIRTHLRPRA